MRFLDFPSFYTNLFLNFSILYSLRFLNFIQFFLIFLMLLHSRFLNYSLIAVSQILSILIKQILCSIVWGDKANFFLQKFRISHIMCKIMFFSMKIVCFYRGGGAGWAGWAFAHPVFREQNRKPLNVPTSKALKWKFVELCLF